MTIVTIHVHEAPRWTSGAVVLGDQGRGVSPADKSSALSTSVRMPTPCMPTPRGGAAPQCRGGLRLLHCRGFHPLRRFTRAHATQVGQRGHLRLARDRLARFPVVDRRLRSDARQLAVFGGGQAQLLAVRLQALGPENEPGYAALHPPLTGPAMMEWAIREGANFQVTTRRAGGSPKGRHRVHWRP